MTMTTSQILNSSGLIIDIIGIIIMFRNSPKVSFSNILYNYDESIELEKIAFKKNRNTKIGLGIIAFGFTLQLVSNFIK